MAASTGDLGGAVAMGAALRELRRRAGITQRDLAAREQLHRNYLGALERGTVANPGLGTTSRLARALGVSVAVPVESFVRPPAPSGQVWVPHGGARGAAAVAPGARGGAHALGRALRLLRRRRGLTRRALAEATGMHKNYIGSLEEGAIASPGVATLTRLVRGLEPALDAQGLAAHVGLLARLFAGEPIGRQRSAAGSGAANATRPGAAATATATAGAAASATRRAAGATATTSAARRPVVASAA